MKLESSALKTKIMHYTIVCLNARSGWIPYDHMLGSSLGLSTKDVLDYSNIENTCFRMAFHFNNQVVTLLQSGVANQPFQRDVSKRRFSISTGNTLNDINFENLRILCNFSNNRINLSLDGIDIVKILEADPEGMQDVKHPIPKIGEYCFIQQMVHDRQYHIIKYLHGMGAQMIFDDDYQNTLSISKDNI